MTTPTQGTNGASEPAKDASLTLRETADAILDGLPDESSTGAEAEAVNERTASAPTPQTTESPAAAPAFHLDPENTSIGRVQRAYLAIQGIAPYTASAPCTAGDIDALRDQISPAQYHELQAAVAARDSQYAEQSATLDNERSQLHAAYPELADPQQAPGEYAQLVETARMFLGDDAPGILARQTDHRVFLILRELKRGNQLRQENAALKAGVHSTQRDAGDEPTPRQPQNRRRSSQPIEIPSRMGIHEAKKIFEKLF